MPPSAVWIYSNTIVFLIILVIYFINLIYNIIVYLTILHFNMLRDIPIL